ncbi:PAS domain-containing protein, partial [Bowmanella yangjiangensis]
KGLFFVLLTSALLYLVLYRHAQRHRRARLELASNEERLRLALNATHDGLWDWDVSKRRVFFSDGYAALLGLTPQALGDTRDDWAARLHPDDREGAMQALSTEWTDQQYENIYRLRHADGSYRWIHSRGRLLHDEDGQPQRFIGIASDVTQQRANDDSLRQAAAVF